MSQYLHELLLRYLSAIISRDEPVVELTSSAALLAGRLPGARVVFSRPEAFAGFPRENVIRPEDVKGYRPAWIVLNPFLDRGLDVRRALAFARGLCGGDTRLLLVCRGGPLRRNRPARGDVAALLANEGFEEVRREGRVLLPFYMPFLSAFVNRCLSPLPFFRKFCVADIVIARPRQAATGRPSVSVVVPARNEAGNIGALAARIPPMGTDDEIIFVEGGSTDGTWEEMLSAQRAQGGRRVVVCRQDGRGKGDAVRKGFSLARNEILMILDADMAVSPEELPRFYRALVSGEGEFVNGSRLIRPMEKGAMCLLNLLGNRFFACAVSFLAGRRFTDVLCGTKALRREHYRKLAANCRARCKTDPWGDLDLIFGACRIGLKIVETPVSYRKRAYGVTKLDPWSHGAELLGVLVSAAARIKFV